MGSFPLRSVRAVKGQKHMTYFTGLRCRHCGTLYTSGITYCERCLGPLEADYVYSAIERVLTRSLIEKRDRNIWRYRELLPVSETPAIGHTTGCTPLIRAKNLGRALGLEKLYIKNDAVNSPTLSFKDRVVAVALSKAKELGLGTVGCASTGNLANSVAANAAAAGLTAYILIPSNLERAKVLGTLVYGARVVSVDGNYDQVNRLCSQLADQYDWGFVNVNLRPYYAEGSKTFGYEIAEDLGWRAPAAVVVPMAGGSLISKIHKGLEEFGRLGLLRTTHETSIFGAQAAGCNPIVAAVKRGDTDVRPVKPQTIAKSLAIGNPADGYWAANIIQRSGGGADDATEDEIRQGIELLASTEGIFAETAGGVTVAVTQKLAAAGKLPVDETVVIAITGNGLKTTEALSLEPGLAIAPKLSDFDRHLAEQGWTEDALVEEVR